MIGFLHNLLLFSVENTHMCLIFSIDSSYDTNGLGHHDDIWFQAYLIHPGRFETYK